jgi:hypothetical protein
MGQHLRSVQSLIWVSWLLGRCRPRKSDSISNDAISEVPMIVVVSIQFTISACDGLEGKTGVSNALYWRSSGIDGRRPLTNMPLSPLLKLPSPSAKSFVVLADGRYIRTTSHSLNGSTLFNCHRTSSSVVYRYLTVFHWNLNIHLPVLCFPPFRATSCLAMTVMMVFLCFCCRFDGWLWMLDVLLKAMI